ncbi:MBL fold metallo-hydrolase [Streptomyces cocklensis]|uniref:Cyclase n=1 Tax=Actinacidiphila cocklensis TaxID=887465 RepID=A0A9W4DYX9_9ACTN|nr:MBL fold metallo-hydrolase [Actinacidiphila cocklensis]MDD1057722.1 MBL fold metallo-hydrolase [Actinacidiphila cocklensis]WSX82020.1 MBL fold metallo-hydrolase [Streptomyces sp. NBC_00899]CAG6398424.1 Cyclase [Actinacidiphila cocklensis]
MPVAIPLRQEVEVADGVVAVVNGDGSAGLSNSVLLLGGPATVIDTMLLPEMAGSIVAALDRRRRRAELVVNTHIHTDHIGGNALFGDVPILAHPRTAAGMRKMIGEPGLPTLLAKVMPAFAERLADWDSVAAQPLPPAGIESALPEGARVVEFTDAHSAADLVVWLPAQQVLVTGDLCFSGVTPLAVHGRVGRWRTALDQLIALRPEVVLPGHGRPAGIGALHDLADYFDRVLAAARLAHTEQLTAEAVWARFDPGPAAGWLEPERTLVNIQVALSEETGQPFQGEHRVQEHPARPSHSG